ncbi:hypothetical protein X943_003698 [Babesia divergens]|uniref:Protein root UVB sensitive/RUS domain-containing protein n=1 Tax=Babesia divergens TaxID=32595 RepID=A0AAD9LFH4_BABDI|nr:hypothetical protein X943_003698 [Babesia divergens]
MENIVAVGHNVGKLIKHAVYPQIVSDEYYSYAHWRMLERFAIATALALASQTQPIGKAIETVSTKDLLKKDVSDGCPQNSWISRITKGKVSSTLANIVLKDIVSRAFNFIWFGKIGAGFDDNPKAFRLLGGVLCSVAGVASFAGNALNFEPKMLLTVCVNVLKHIGMLTMLASQAAFHTTFCVKNAATNVGEITAKLEAQSPICDFVGMAAGMQLGIMLASKPYSVQAGVFTGVSVISNIASYMCAKSVCFRNLNPQRCFILLEDFASALLRRLDRYLRYHKLRLEALRHRMDDDDDDSDDGDDIDSSSSSSSNSCFEDDECGAITEMIYNYEFDTATRLLHRFTSKHLCNKLKKARETADIADDSNVRYPDEPLNLLQKRIRMKFLTPEVVASREPLMFPWRDGALKHGAIKYSLADMSVCPETLAEYLKIFKGQKFVVVLGSDGIVECAIHRSAKPRDAILAILTYNIAEKLWTLLDESTEPDFIDHQLEQIWDMCKRSAVSLKDVLVRLNSTVNHRPMIKKRAYDGDQLREEKELWRWGLQTVRYAYTMAESCIDEVMLSIEAANWNIERFELSSPFKN